MKKIIPLLCIVFVTAMNSQAQSLAAVDQNKYRINLPDFWKPGNKIWKILTDKLPLVCDELKDKDLCGDDCNPKYSIEFEMSEPEVFDYYPNHISTGTTTETWEFVTLYTFKASLLLFNEKDKLLVRFILVDTNETWRITRTAQLRSYVPSRPQPISMVVGTPSRRTQADNPAPIRQTAQPGQSPWSYINSNKEKLQPTQRDMLNIIDEKIRSW